MASPVTLAKRIKKLVQVNHPELVVRDGVAELPTSIKLNLVSELEASKSNIMDNLSNLATMVSLQLEDVTVPLSTDESSAAKKQRNLLYAVRALRTLGNSPKGIEKTIFQSRLYDYQEVEPCFRNSTADFEELKGISGIFQFKRHDEEGNPWKFSWLLTVEGISVSRGTTQPIHKMVTALLSFLPAKVTNSSDIQSIIADLANMNTKGEELYWYLSNQHTAMYYKAFMEYCALKSCMSHPTAYYTGTGTGQHPMNCYDDSPDWSLMMLSTKSPEEIVSMCDLVIANPDEAATTFKFPFISRCMVLPTKSEISGRDFKNIPYVYGKFYGRDDLAAHFKKAEDSTSRDIAFKNNPLICISSSIDGGCIKAIPSDLNNKHLLLPYFDASNKARLIKKEDGLWWMSYGIIDDSTFKEPIAECSYTKGIAQYVSYYSPARDSRCPLNTPTSLETMTTLFGEDLLVNNNYYVEYTIGDRTMLVPASMLIKDIDSTSILQGQGTTLYDGSVVATSTIAAQTDRFSRLPSIGVFDMLNPLHAEVYNNIDTYYNTPPMEDPNDIPF